MTNLEEVNQKYCEVCGGLTPAGHRICDNCWPDAAISKSLAAYCAICGTPRLKNKLKWDAQQRLVCMSHLA